MRARQHARAVPARPAAEGPVGEEGRAPGAAAPPPSLERIVAYLCMTPRSRARDLAALAGKRFEAFRQGLGTNHLPQAFEPKPPPPERQGVPVRFDHVPVALDARQRRLAGFDVLEA